MAAVSKVSNKDVTKPVVGNIFSKEQLVKSKRYMLYADFLNGNLQEGRKYTTEQVDELISKYYGKGKVR